MAVKKKWYQEASVQAAIVGGIFLVLAALVSFFSSKREDVPPPDDHDQMVRRPGWVHSGAWIPSERDIYRSFQKCNQPIQLSRRDLICHPSSLLVPISLERKGAANLGDEAQIRGLIAAEAETSIGRNVSGYISLFHQKALLFDGNRRSEGCDSILERNLAAHRKICFFSISHVVEKIDITGDFASVESDLDGSYFIFEARKGKVIAHIFDGGGREEWTFVKGQDSVWRIMTFKSATASHLVDSTSLKL